MLCCGIEFEWYSEGPVHNNFSLPRASNNGDVSLGGAAVPRRSLAGRCAQLRRQQHGSPGPDQLAGFCSFTEAIRWASHCSSSMATRSWQQHLDCYSAGSS